MKRSGFTMIELIFVIVILGILAAVAIPRLAATRDDAKIAKMNTDAATFVSDLGSYYTAKGTFGTATVGDVTNVAFGTTSAPLATTTTLAGATLNLAEGDNICLVFKPLAVATGDGNMTVSAGAGTSAICQAIKASAVKSNLLGAANADKNVSFGGTSVVQIGRASCRERV